MDGGGSATPPPYGEEVAVTDAGGTPRARTAASCSRWPRPAAGPATSRPPARRGPDAAAGHGGVSIRFSEADLARTRVAGMPHPALEVALSLRVLGSSSVPPHLARWRRQVEPRLPPQARGRGCRGVGTRSSRTSWTR